MSDLFTMQDPTKQYPRPPFPPQPQSAPGLAADMNPKPDHGETSYKGSGRLHGRKALITGADSGIGCAVAIAFAREGADLVLTYLPEEERDAQEVVQLVEAAGRRVVAIPGDLQDEHFCFRLVEQGRTALGGLDILVNVAGKQTAQKDIADITTAEFDATFRTNVYAMFWLCRRRCRTCRRVRRSSTPRRSSPTSRRRPCWTTRPPRPPSPPSPTRWPSRLPPRASG